MPMKTPWKTMALGIAACSLIGACGPRPTPRTAGPRPDARVVEQAYPTAPRTWSSAFLFLPGSIARELVRFEIVNGMAMMEGDIKLGDPAQLLLRYGRPWLPSNVQYANAVAGSSYLWPNGVIPYEIASSVGARQRDDVAWAVGHVNTTELNLRPRTAADRDYIIFRNAGADCSSFVGRVGGGQSLDIGGCSRGSIPHEILHAAGFYHEHTRMDRDQFVTINWNEISPGHENNFQKNTGRSQDVGSYDYSSIMHYSAGAFSRTGRPTIVPKVPNAPIGQRDELSQLDRQGISQLYAGAAPVPPPQPPQPGPNPQPGPSNGSFAGTYTSERGDVSCSQNGSTVACNYPGGSMLCSANGNQLDCGWSGGGGGRAAFTRQTDGRLNGTYGDFFSNNSRGAWNLVPAGGPQPPPPAPAPAPAPAPGPEPTTPPAPTGPDGSLSGNFSSNRGPMTCDERGAGVACTFTEDGVSGRLDCWNDTTGLRLTCTWATYFPRPGSGRAILTRQSRSERSLSGTWGTFTSADNGGSWTVTPQ